jgi:hypothetical protein
MSANRGKSTNFQQVRFGARKEVSMDAECGLKFPANPHNAESTNIGIEERLHLARESAAGLLAMWLETLEEGHHILPDFFQVVAALQNDESRQTGAASQPRAGRLRTRRSD